MWVCTCALSPQQHRVSSAGRLGHAFHCNDGELMSVGAASSPWDNKGLTITSKFHLRRCNRRIITLLVCWAGILNRSVYSKTIFTEDWTSHFPVSSLKVHEQKKLLSSMFTYNKTPTVFSVEREAMSPTWYSLFFLFFFLPCRLAKWLNTSKEKNVFLMCCTVEFLSYLQ